MNKFFSFLFIKRHKSVSSPLNEQKMAEYLKSKDDLNEANRKLQQVIEENHFTLNIKKALDK